MHEYFYGRFRAQLAGIAFHRPSGVVREHIMRDPAVVFFGGANWENIAADLGNVPESDRSRFVLCLFMVVLTDQALYTYFRDSYDAWRRETNFPKFGWSGFGPHNENPFKILWAPERVQAVSTNDMLSLVPEFTTFLVNETKAYFGKILPTVEINRYFGAIRGDRGYAFNEGLVVPRVKVEFENLTMP